MVPVSNYVTILLAVRRPNSQLGDAVNSQQMSAVFQREKKVAFDMWIITILLLASLIPAAFLKILELRYPRVHSIVAPWSVTMSMIT